MQGSLQSQYIQGSLQSQYVAGVWTKTAKGYFKNVEEQVIWRQSKVWSNHDRASKTKKYLLKNSTISNQLLF